VEGQRLYVKVAGTDQDRGDTSDSEISLKIFPLLIPPETELWKSTRSPIL